MFYIFGNYKVSQKNWTLLLSLQVVTSSFFLGHLVLCMICTVLNCHITCSIFTNQNCVCRVLKRIGGHWLKRQVDGDKFICMDNLLVKDKCLIYSFGISNDWTFEDLMDSAGHKNIWIQLVDKFENFQNLTNNRIWMPNSCLWPHNKRYASQKRSTDLLFKNRHWVWSKFEVFITTNWRKQS